MRLPTLQGVIRRRLLVNFRVDPVVMQRQLPAPFVPKLHDGFAIAGICLIRLEEIRPPHVPALLGVSSENAAHRVAVRWKDGGREREGVFIPRRDTGSRLNHLAGGRLFPGEHHLATFGVADDGESLSLRMESADGGTSLAVSGCASEHLPESSSFNSLSQASSFFEPGALGYSVSSDPGRLHGVSLRTKEWSVRPFAVSEVSSSYFSDPSRFPGGSITFDHALIMRGIEHEWLGADDLHTTSGAS